jgi:hypothetical protein
MRENETPCKETRVGAGKPGSVEAALLVEIRGEHGEMVWQQIMAPKLGTPRPPHDWRFYIPSSLKARWGKLSLEARAAAFVVAELAADLENPD